ncbi:hypothetical protein GCM10008992_31790 [Halorubrum aquaticum]
MNMGEQPPVLGIHDGDRTTEFCTDESDVFVCYDPEDPQPTLLQGGTLQTPGPTLR